MWPGILTAHNHTCIPQISYFGLQYQTKSESMHWVDKEKALRKQLEKHGIDGARNAELRFGIQYYVTSVTKLQYEITRYGLVPISYSQLPVHRMWLSI